MLRGGEYLESNRILIFEDILLELTNILSHLGGGVGGQQECTEQHYFSSGGAGQKKKTFGEEPLLLHF